jgi:hypothetical protein
VTNNCGGTIWPAMADIGGSTGAFQGWEASPGFSKTLNVEDNFVGRICTPSCFVPFLKLTTFQGLGKSARPCRTVPSHAPPQIVRPLLPFVLHI